MQLYRQRWSRADLREKKKKKGEMIYFSLSLVRNKGLLLGFLQAFIPTVQFPSSAHYLVKDGSWNERIGIFTTIQAIFQVMTSQFAYY